MSGTKNSHDCPSDSTYSPKPQFFNRFFNRKEIRWLRVNLFNGLFNSMISIALIALTIVVLLSIIKWAFINSVWQAESYVECREIIASALGKDGYGACWAVIHEKFDILFFGFYPSEQYWRPIFTVAFLPIALLPILHNSLSKKLLLFSIIYPVGAYILLLGGFGLEHIDTHRFGGFLLTLIVAVSSTATAIIFGVILAFSRPFLIWPIRVIYVVFFEICRGVPTVVLLFFGITILNYFLPPGVAVDVIFRVIIFIALPSIVLVAETIRGCLLEIPQGQLDAARALGLSQREAFWKIRIQQALRNATPQIILIAGKIFRDTSLLSIIGLITPLWLSNSIRRDENWHGAYLEIFLVVGLFYWLCCFSITSYSKYHSRKLYSENKPTLNQKY